MAYIEERKSSDGSARYRVQIRLKGYPTQTATFKRKTDAKRWAQDTESAIRDRRHFKTAESKRHTLSDLIDRYIRDVLPNKPKSYKKQKQQLNWWKEQIGAYLLVDVTPALIAEYRDKLSREETSQERTRAPASVVRYMAALSHAFTIAVREWGWLDSNPMQKVTKPKEPRGRVRFLDDDERNNLLEACRQSTNPYLYPVVVLALSTGMRQGEIMNLTWNDVDLHQGQIILHETKNGERRAVPLAGHALGLLKEHAKVKRLDTALLFPSPHMNKPIDLRTPWLKALKKAKIDDFRFHDLRHSAASYLAMGGATSGEIADVLGHKTLAMVKRYAHLSEQHTAGVVARMNEKIFGA